MKITVELLAKMKACKEAIDFIARNYPEGIDLDKYKINGDYNGWVEWLRNELKVKREYDSHDNMIKKTWPNGKVYRWEYDSHGNLIKRTYPNGSVYKWEYPFGAIIENGKKICWLEEIQG